MSHHGWIKISLAGAAVAAVATFGWAVHAQTPAAAAPAQSWVGMKPTNDLPMPYETFENYFKLPGDRKFGATSAIEIDKDGKTIWVAERCGANSGCLANPTVDPILHFDEKGNLIKSFGAGKIISPHGIFVDKDGNIWVTDYQDNGTNAARGAAAPGGGARGAAPAAAGGAPVAAEPPAGGGRGGGRGARGGGAAAGGAAPAAAGGAAPAAAAAGAGQGRAAAPAPVIPNPTATMGHQIIKYDRNGKELMRLGRAGGAKPPECCYQPNDVLVAPNGTIFVVQGHGTAGVNLAFKFDKTGKLLQTFGKDGTGPGEFNQPHALAMDSKGRLFIGDRANNRIQIFDQDFKFIADWAQFSRPSGIFIDKKDNLYSADSESGGINPAHGEWKRGIRIGSAKDGKVTAIIPDPLPTCAAGQQPGNPRTCATGTWVAEGVAADSKGNIFGAEVGPQKVQRYALKKK